MIARSIALGLFDIGRAGSRGIIFVRLTTGAQLFVVGGQQGGLYDRMIRISRVQDAGRISDVVGHLATSFLGGETKWFAGSF